MPIAFSTAVKLRILALPSHTLLPVKLRPSVHRISRVCRRERTEVGELKDMQSEQQKKSQSTRCCIVGCGPAGAMLGFLLARRGIGVLVLEKHADFLRDFRGDTIHPSTIEILQEVGLADQLLHL